MIKKENNAWNQRTWAQIPFIQSVSYRFGQIIEVLLAPTFGVVFWGSGCTKGWMNGIGGTGVNAT